MVEKKRPEMGLWMFREKGPEPEPGQVNFDPVDAIYHLRKNTRNPYLERAIAPTAERKELSPAKIARLFRGVADRRGYVVEPANRHEPYTRRSLPHPAPAGAIRPSFQETEKLPGDIHKLPWLINEFFQLVLTRLRANPAEFDLVVDELLALFQEGTVKIRFYDAYYTFQDWDQFMDTLEEISHYPAPETFDLFCSALFTYYELVYPPEG